jgi:perosamine synthetase
MDVRQVEARITPRTRAIMAVHIYGHPVDMDPLLRLAEQHGLTVIEDAAEAHGAEYKGRKCGGLGHISVFSFYANKLITTGEGGMLLTRSHHVAERARYLKNLAFQKSRRFLHDELGDNLRLTNLQAALGVGQIERIEQIVNRKRAIAATYAERLSDLPGVMLPAEALWAKNVYWVFGLVLDESTALTAAEWGQRLVALGVETRPFFLGMHEQPAFQRMGLFLGEKYPVAERLARQGLYLPTGLGLSEAEIDQVSTAVRDSLKQSTVVYHRPGGLGARREQRVESAQDSVKVSQIPESRSSLADARADDLGHTAHWPDREGRPMVATDPASKGGCR